MNEQESLPPNTVKTFLIAFGIFCALLVTIFIAYNHAKKRPGNIILPGGTTYLGPTPTSTPARASEKFVVADDSPWGTYEGKVYPYSFSYPTTLSLGLFPDDPFDSVTLFWENTNSQENVFFRVENLKGTEYLGKPKKEYVHNWWKQYLWTGVSKVTEFKNSRGLVGYRALYIDEEGKTPFENIFFEVPGKPELIIWMTDRLIPKEVFDRMVDSVTWQIK